MPLSEEHETYSGALEPDRFTDLLKDLYIVASREEATALVAQYDIQPDGVSLPIHNPHDSTNDPIHLLQQYDHVTVHASLEVEKQEAGRTAVFEGARHEGRATISVAEEEPYQAAVAFSWEIDDLSESGYNGVIDTAHSYDLTEE